VRMRARLRTVPSPIELPPCLLDSCRVIFPTLDFSRIAFFLGIPRGISGASGFTMSSGGAGRDIRVYLTTYDPRSRATFLLLAHELVHALQIQGMRGGSRIPGSWVTYYISHAIGRGGGVQNELENEAYSFTNGSSERNGVLREFLDTSLRGAEPCAHEGSTDSTSTTARAESFAELLQKNEAPTKVTSVVGHAPTSLLTAPISTIAGAFSIFGFSNTGGAIGSLAGIGAGGIVGSVFAGTRLGAIGVVCGAWLGAHAGAITGGAIGRFIDSLVGRHGAPPV
jgi:hypothetical protein